MKEIVVALFHLEPSVDGGFGTGTQICNRIEESSAVPDVVQLEYSFDDWNGDELVSSFPCHLISSDLYEQFLQSKLSGVASREVVVTASELLRSTKPNLILPSFVWLTPLGRVGTISRTLSLGKNGMQKESTWSGHDVCLGPNAELIFSNKAMKSIAVSRIPRCRIKAFPCLHFAVEE